MITRFEKLLSLEVAHDYYGGACPDVGFVVPEDVARAMRGAGLVVKGVEGALLVYSSSPVSAARAAGKTLRIGLLVQSGHFANITEGFDPKAGALLYRNGTTAGTFDDPPARVALCGPSFSRPLAAPARPVSVTLRDAAGRALRSATVTAAHDQPDISFDLGDLAPGALMLEEAYPGGVNRSSRHYLDPELWRRGVFAVVEIAVDRAFYAQAASFRITFPARRETLRYYVVVKGFSNGDVDQLVVSDQGGAPGRPDEVKFEKVPPAQLSEDEKSRSDLLAGDGGRVLLFRSLSAVTRQSNGRKRIQLMRNTEALIENLPQPGKDRGTADLIIHLSKSKT